MYRLTNSRIALAFSYARALFLALAKMLVSSAKSTNSVLLCAFDRSFMYTRKSNGPRQLPCGHGSAIISKPLFQKAPLEKF